MKCKKHPTYQIKREPRGDCQTCWVLWLASEVKRLTAAVVLLEQQQIQQQTRDDWWL